MLVITFPSQIIPSVLVSCPFGGDIMVNPIFHFLIRNETELGIKTLPWSNKIIQILSSSFVSLFQFEASALFF